MARVVAALSGGVDSGVAAALLVEQGHEVTGVMLQLWAEPGAAASDNRCCTPQAVDRARGLARQLGIPFQLLDARGPFRQAVVETFVSEYAAARTPNPCILCNREIRFGLLLRWALERGAEFAATGHYARVRRTGDCYQLLRGLDPIKDQSYVLHALSQQQLAHVLFPLGELTKQQVRAFAYERALPVAGQRESQDICFVADGDYRRFLAEHAPATTRPGPIVDHLGRTLGRHEGLVNYTVGQRRGIGVAARYPLYVLALDPERNRLLVGPAESLGRMECQAAQVHFVSGREPPGPFDAMVKIRYRHCEERAHVTPLPGQRVRVRFARPQRDVTPGQYLVLYDGEAVLGGGVICADRERGPWDQATPQEGGTGQ
jgi:tRNA-specific 2-thiouridylase